MRKYIEIYKNSILRCWDNLTKSNSFGKKCSFKLVEYHCVRCAIDFINPFSFSRVDCSTYSSILWMGRFKACGHVDESHSNYVGRKSCNLFHSCNDSSFVSALVIDGASSFISLEHRFKLNEKNCQTITQIWNGFHVCNYFLSVW